MAQVKEIQKLTLKDMMMNPETYYGLADGLAKLPAEQFITIRKRRLPVPQNLDEFMNNLCYGQRIFLTQEEPNDYGVILRVFDGYYYPLYYGKDFDRTKALQFGKIVINCKAKDLYPVAMQLVELNSQLVAREKELLHREPSKIELAAGIEKLNVFSDLTAIDFLRDNMKVSVEQVMLTPYKECLVRFMIAKETEAYKERYIQLLKEESKAKEKKHGK